MKRQDSKLPKFQGDKKSSQVGSFFIPPMPTMPEPIQLIGNIINAFSEKKRKPAVLNSNVEKTIHIRLKDPRKVRMTTGSKINPNRDLMSGDYALNDMEEAIKRARKRGLSLDDAWNMAAIDFQETLLGNRDNEMGHAKDYQGEDNIDRFLNAYQDKMKTADRLKYKDPYLRLQVYNGLGKVYPETEQWYHGFKANSFYGVPVPKSGLDLRKNPLYGKQIVDLRDNVLKKNPEFIKFINTAYGEGMKRNGGMITDPRGQWAYPGQNTRIPGSNITMQGVPYPVLAKANNGMTVMMYPGQDYSFPGADYVDEYPMMSEGGLVKYQTKGQVTRSPIYTDDPRKVQAYQDSVGLYNSYISNKEMLDKRYKNKPGYYIENTSFPKNPDGSICYNCIKKEAAKSKSYGNFLSSLNNTQLANPDINPQGYVNYLKDNLAFDKSQGKIYDYSNVKPVQPYILQQKSKPGKWKPLTKEIAKGRFSGDISNMIYRETGDPNHPYNITGVPPKPEPRLKGKVSKVEKLPMGELSQAMERGLIEREMPNISAPDVEMSGPYMVGYHDYDTQEGIDRGFRTAEERDAFVEELRKRPAGNYQPSMMGITSYYDVNKRKKKANGGDISIPDLPQQPFSKIRIKAYGGPMVRYMAGKMTGPNIF